MCGNKDNICFLLLGMMNVVKVYLLKPDKYLLKDTKSYVSMLSSFRDTVFIENDRLRDVGSIGGSSVGCFRGLLRSL